MLIGDQVFALQKKVGKQILRDFLDVGEVWVLDGALLFS